MSDFAPQFGLALIVVAVAIAAIIMSRRNYRKSAAFERNIDAFRLEFQHSIDAAQAATIKSVAKTIRDSISLVIRPIDSTMRELDARLARLEQQQADATPSDTGGAEIFDVHLARLEQHADGAIRNLADRFAGLEKHTEATASQITGTQKQALEENERIAARLIGVEQKLTAVSEQLSAIGRTVEAATLSQQENLATLADQQQNMTALSDQFSSIKQTIDKPNIPEQDIKDSIDTVSSRILHTQTRLDELLPRLVLGDKARQDQATLIGLLVKRIKKLNAKLSEVALRIGALEIRLPLKAPQLQEHHSSILEGSDRAITGKPEDQASKAVDDAVATATEADGQNGGILQPPTKGEESPNEASPEEGGSHESRVDQHAT